jgi:3-oxocholest-4-en-26-oyl-CoA dehydrogenase alpha subunit
MDFRLSAEEETFRREVEAFLATELTDEVRGGNLIDTPAREAFVSKMAERGWLARGVPQEYGGAGKPMPLAPYILNLELQKVHAPNVGKNLGVIVNTLLLHGSEQLKQAFIRRTVQNEIQWALCYSEPEAGSDLANMQTRAVLDGDDFVLNGHKRFITSAHFADFIWTGVRTDPDAPKHKGISVVIVEADAPGITITPMYTTTGERTNEVFFDNVRVPKERLVGELNRGWYYISQALDYERFTILSFTPTIRKFERLVAWVKQAQIGGKRLAADPIVRRKIAHLAVLVEAGRMLELRCISMAIRPNYVPNVEAAMNRMWCALTETQMSNDELDIMGPFGYLWSDSELSPMNGEGVSDYLRAGHKRVAAGGVDVNRNIIARRYLGLPMS